MRNHSLPIRVPSPPRGEGQDEGGRKICKKTCFEGKELPLTPTLSPKEAVAKVIFAESKVL